MKNTLEYLTLEYLFLGAPMEFIDREYELDYLRRNYREESS